MVMRTLNGAIVNLRDDSPEWGRESFSMTDWGGGRSMRSLTEFDPQRVLREASWSVDADWNPRESFTREVIENAFVSSSWFRIDGEDVECEAVTRKMGRVSQRLKVGRPIDYLGLHTILADCLVAAARGCTEPGVEKTISCVTNSLASYGMGEYHAQAVLPLVTYVGPEPIEVRAGRFDGEHFQVRWNDLLPECSDFWVLPGDFVPLRLRGAWDPVTYELASLTIQER